LYACVKASPFAAKIMFALNKIYRVPASAVVEENMHTRSCKKSNVMGPPKYFGIKYLFSFLHPYSKDDLGGGFVGGLSTNMKASVKAVVYFLPL
jgi:hypothetical protein